MSSPRHPQKGKGRQCRHLVPAAPQPAPPPRCQPCLALRSGAPRCCRLGGSRRGYGQIRGVAAGGAGHGKGTLRSREVSPSVTRPWPVPVPSSAITGTPGWGHTWELCCLGVITATSAECPSLAPSPQLLAPPRHPHAPEVAAGRWRAPGGWRAAREPVAGWLQTSQPHGASEVLAAAPRRCPGSAAVTTSHHGGRQVRREPTPSPVTVRCQSSVPAPRPTGKHYPGHADPHLQPNPPADPQTRGWLCQVPPSPSPGAAWRWRAAAALRTPRGGGKKNRSRS